MRLAHSCPRLAAAPPRASAMPAQWPASVRAAPRCHRRRRRRLPWRSRRRLRLLLDAGPPRQQIFAASAAVGGWVHVSAIRRGSDAGARRLLRAGRASPPAGLWRGQAYLFLVLVQQRCRQRVTEQQLQEELQLQAGGAGVCRRRDGRAAVRHHKSRGGALRWCWQCSCWHSRCSLHATHPPTHRQRAAQTAPGAPDQKTGDAAGL